MNNLSTLWSNPHLRYAAIGIVVIEVLAIWFPSCKTQLDQTEKVIMFYACAAAANSSPQPPKSV